MRETYVALLLIALLAVANIYVTLRVVRDTVSETRQKAVQVLVIWLVPALGAIVTWLLISHEPKQAELGYSEVPPDMSSNIGGQIWPSESSQDAASHDAHGSGH